jgi:hypothetical protein
VTNCCDNQPLTPFIISAINCWSVRCHDICVLMDRYLVPTIPHCSGCRGYLAYRTVGNNLVVSVAWQWIFPALGNSTLQTTRHTMMADQHTTEIPPQQENSRQQQPANQTKPRATTCNQLNLNNQRQLQ